MLRVNWLAPVPDAEEEKTEDNGRRSEFGGLLGMERGKTAAKLVEALQEFTDELRSYQVVLAIPEERRTYMYNWREAGLDNENTNRAFVRLLNGARRAEVAKKAAEVSSNNIKQTHVVTEQFAGIREGSHVETSTTELPTMCRQLLQGPSRDVDQN